MKLLSIGEVKRYARIANPGGLSTDQRRTDPLLMPFLRATAEAESQQLLSDLIASHVEPVIGGILGRKLGGPAGGAAGRARGQEAEEIHGNVLVRVLAWLRDLKAGPEDDSVADLRGYVAVVTYHTFNDHLRRRYPARWRLKSRLRYLLGHDRCFALWETSGGEWLCGMAASRGGQERPGAGRLLDELHDRSQVGERHAPPPRPGDPDPRELAALVSGIFQRVGGPVGLDALVGTLMRLCGLTEPAVERDAGAGGERRAEETLPDPRADQAALLEQRSFLQRLWREIQDLPPRQRAALLLNLRDTEGRGAIALFPITGVASVRQIAAALQMPPERLAGIWSRLPLDDAAIADDLGITRQQVINLRKSGRERLARRMKDPGVNG